MSIIVVLPCFLVPSVNKSDFFLLTVAETSLDMKQSSQRAACAVVERSITRIQSNITIETHTFAPDPELVPTEPSKLTLPPLSSYIKKKGDDLISHPLSCSRRYRIIEPLE